MIKLWLDWCSVELLTCLPKRVFLIFSNLMRFMAALSVYKRERLKKLIKMEMCAVFLFRLLTLPNQIEQHQGPSRKLRKWCLHPPKIQFVGSKVPLHLCSCRILTWFAELQMIICIAFCLVLQKFLWHCGLILCTKINLFLWHTIITFITVNYSLREIN